MDANERVHRWHPNDRMARIAVGAKKPTDRSFIRLKGEFQHGARVPGINNVT